MDPVLEQTTEERMFSKIVGFKKRMNDIQYTVCSLADRQDDKFGIVTGSK